MRKRKLSGFDLNGWRDTVAKNWQSTPGEEDTVGPLEVISSDALSAVVKVGDPSRERWIGGPQADLAPHGLGGGWGVFGAEDRRIMVRSLFEAGHSDLPKLAAAFEGLAQGADYNVASIDEGDDGSERVQERLLSALATGKYRNTMLVWRPVLAALHAIETGLLQGGQKIGVINHVRKGVSIQTLRIRETDGAVLVPERGAAARMAGSTIGFQNLVEIAREAAIGPGGQTERTAHRAGARSIGRAALGMRCGPEMLRLRNGDWEMIDLSELDVIKYLDEGGFVSAFDDCDLVLVETLAEGQVRGALISRIKDRAPVRVEALGHDAVAKGALVAADRLSTGTPVYFDFLPGLSTIVYGSEGAANYDLIRSDETLEAGKLYRSPEPAKLAIPPGQERIAIYLRKETEARPRRAEVQIGKPLKSQEQVALWVEQKPAAGRAKIVLEAKDLRRNFTVDWDDAEIDERTWDEIIESLDTQVSIPQRLILPCGMHAWHDTRQSLGLSSLLRMAFPDGTIEWKVFAAKLEQRPFREYCVSSDGEFPSEVDPQDIDRLDQLTEKAVILTRRQIDGLEKPDNSALKVLTWQFRRCPRDVVDWLLDCIETGGVGHPFVQHHAGWILVFQGLGRIVRDQETEERVMSMLLSSDMDGWHWRQQTACMAFLLSRSDTAPLLLSRDDVERLARRTVTEFRHNLDDRQVVYTKFHYAPFLLAGLLRWRLKNPTGLLLNVDELASDLFQAVDDVETDIKFHRPPSPQLNRIRKKYLPILSDLKAELRGKGTNPNLLLDIYD